MKIVAGSLPVLAAVWIGAAGYGYTLRVLLIQKQGGVIEELALGIAGLLIVNWLVAWTGLLTQNGAVAVFGFGSLLNLLKLMPVTARDRLERRVPILPWCVLLLVPGLAMLLMAASCPPGTLWRVEAFGYDVTSYHLQLPQEWLAMGRMAGLEHNVYSFLPSLMEGGYLLIGVLSGSVIDAVYTCQLFHVTLALLAGAAIGKAVASRASVAAGIGAAAIYLATPWVTITGSMAYNEMGVMAFGAVALLILFGEHGNTRGGAIAIGLLVGAATLCKLTAGVMVALPVGLILLTGWQRSETASSEAKTASNLQLAAIAALAGLLTLSPYLVRNYAATGNPVFPFAAETLGAGHWDQELVERWDTAHGLSPKEEGKLDALGRQWLFNSGYGAVGGQVTPRETENIARFDREGGLPVLWIAVAAAGVLVMLNRGTRKIGGALLMMLGVQVGFWLFATHLQSRFLLPTLLPACLIAGLGYDRLRTITKDKTPTVAPLIGSAVIITLITMSYVTLVSQTRTIPSPETGEPLQTPIWMAIDAPIDNADHPINRLPEDSKTLMVADNSGLLYLSRQIVYASAFDEAPLGKVIRATKGTGNYVGPPWNPNDVNAVLHEVGITHVWVHWSELNRLHSTYGHDRDVTVESLKALIATGWQPVEWADRSATLYKLP